MYWIRTRVILGTYWFYYYLDILVDYYRLSNKKYFSWQIIGIETKDSSRLGFHIRNDYYQKFDFSQSNRFKFEKIGFYSKI